MGQFFSAKSSMAENIEASNSDSSDDDVPVIQPPTDSKHPPMGTIILLHGAGDSGPNFEHWIRFRLGKCLKFPHLKIVYPTASERPYSPCSNYSRVWFDFPNGIIFNDPEDNEGIASRAEEIVTLINKEIQNGIATENIILGGLSQGGIMSLHVGLRNCASLNLGGIFALSSYLPENSSLYSDLKNQASVTKTPIYLANGSADHLIKHDWGQDTFAKLKNLGVCVSFKTYQDLGHDMCNDELEDLEQWILTRVPQLNADTC